MASSNLRAYSLIYVLDASQVGLNGVIKGLGLQNKAQNFAFVSYFFIGLPSAYVFGIHLGFGLNGLWYGFAIGLLALTFFYT